MTFLTSSTGADSILPDEYAELITGPVMAQSIAFAEPVATVVPTDSHTFHIPVLREDVASEWVREGDEITPDDPTLDEVRVTPAKVAGLTVVSRELADDSTPAAQELVGASLARSIVGKIDQAFLGNLASPAPAGLESVASTPANTLSLTGESFKDFGLDPFAWAVSVAEADGSNVSAFLAHPDDALAMAQMVDAVDSRRPLLADARAVMDRPVLVNRHVTPGTIWAVDRSRIFTVLRQDTTIAVSDGPFFTSDSVAIRATMRVGFGFPHPGSALRIQLEAAD